MTRRAWPLAFVLMGAAPVSAVRDFTVHSVADGFPLHGQIDLPAGKPRGGVVMFQGSGQHRRDYDFSVPGSPQPSFLFRELAALQMKDGGASLAPLKTTPDVIAKPKPKPTQTDQVATR